MALGLPVSRLINVALNLSPQAAQFANFNSLLVMGDSNVINVDERIRSYGSLEEVATDFGTTAPEYLAALLFFSQIPQPAQLYIGRWAEADTHGYLFCGLLTAAQQTMSNWTAISDGGFKVAIDGGAVTSVTNLDFSAQTNLNGVATIITTRLGVAGLAATCAWNGSQFVFQSTATGDGSTVSALTAAAGGDTDISAMLKGTAATLEAIVDGIDAETALEAVIILDALQTSWYALMFASTNMTDDDSLDVAAYIEAASNPHLFGVSSTDTNMLSSLTTDDIASLLQDAGYYRSFVQYSENPYAVASFFGRALTVDFNGNNTVLTMMYKVEPGVVAESLTSTQADVLQDKRANVYVNYNNDTAILQYGTMAGAVFFDDIHDLDWLRDRIRTEVFNLLYTSTTKIPQTDAGNHQIATAIEAACAAGVNNGMIAPGQWNAAGFGQLKQGDFLAKGYYIFAPPISTQSQADREARKSVSFQVAVKLAGAIHTVQIDVNVNR